MRNEQKWVEPMTPEMQRIANSGYIVESRISPVNSSSEHMRKGDRQINGETQIPRQYGSSSGSSETMESIHTPIFTLPTMFDPSQVTHIDLSQLNESKTHAFETGCLPKWICHFQRLQILKAPKTGIIILEPWLLRLKNLRALYLEHNQITTWPYFLCQLRELEILCLDGNPCLENAFRKSPTFRSWFFNWNAASESYKTIPAYIRGSEWPPASSVRLSNSAGVNHLGFFCGGIYTLSVKPNLSNDGLLTPLEPNPLITRLNRRASEPPSIVQGVAQPPTRKGIVRSQSAFSVATVQQPRLEYASTEETIANGGGAFSVSERIKQSRMVHEVFNDITFLLRRHALIPRRLINSPVVLLAGNPGDAHNRLLTNKDNTKLTQKEMYKFICELVQEEEKYIKELEFVVKELYEAKTRSASISHSLRIAFTGFPAMLSIHSKVILPALTQISYSALALYRMEQSSKCLNQQSSQYIRLEQLIADKHMEITRILCISFRRLRHAFEFYIKNLWRAESLLDVPFVPTRLYEDDEFGHYVKSQMTKLGPVTLGHSGGSFTGYSQTAFSMDMPGGSFGQQGPFKGSYGFPPSSAPSPQTRSSSMISQGSLSQPSAGPALKVPHRGVKKLKGNKSRTLHDWVQKQLRKPVPSITRHPVNSLYLPLARLVRYERFFSSFALSNKLYEPAVRIVREMRKFSASEIQDSRAISRCQVLAKKFRTTPQHFIGYQWDVVLAIRSRSYFENGLLSKNTNDVIDFDNKSVSFVKEVFQNSRPRILRLICCGRDVMIADEVFEMFIGRIDKNKLIATSSGTPYQNEIRIVIVDVQETCLVEVKDFKARYWTTQDYRKEFLDACNCDCKTIL